MSTHLDQAARPLSPRTLSSWRVVLRQKGEVASMWERGAMRPLATRIIMKHTMARGLEQSYMSVAEGSANKLAQGLRLSLAVGQPPSTLR